MRGAARRDGNDMSRPVSDVLASVADVNQRIGPLLVELLNTERGGAQAENLRELGRHLGSLSAECLARAAEVDGRCVEAPSRIVIDARD